MSRTLLTIVLSLLFIPTFAQQIPCKEGNARDSLYRGNFISLSSSLADNFFDGNNTYHIIPKGSQTGTFFAASLWFGGLDLAGNLRVSGEEYRLKDPDFWPGPISNIDSTTNAVVCADFNKIWNVSRADVKNFIEHRGKPGYISPEVILSWPGNGDQSLGHDQFLAPFHDQNGNGVYEPDAGDYPAFNINGSIACENSLKGDQVLFSVFNDIGGTQGTSGGNGLGMEIHKTVYCFANGGKLKNQQFHNYKLINKSANSYKEFYIAQHADSDLGHFQDDFIGISVEQGLGYFYNADPQDQLYGSTPPVAGVKLFQGPKADPSDGIDNNRNLQLDEANEEWIFVNAISYNSAGGTNTTAPSSDANFYSYMKAEYLDSSIFTHPNGLNRSTMMYPDSSDLQYGWSYGGQPSSPIQLPPWSEESVGNAAGDRMMVLSAGPFTFEPGEVVEITAGYLFEEHFQSNKRTVQELKITADSLQAMFDNCFQKVPCESFLRNMKVHQNELTVWFSYDGDISNISWDFGDGNTSTDLLPLHQYSQPGSYTVTVNYSNSCGSKTGVFTVDAFKNTGLFGPVLTRLEGKGTGGAKYLDLEASYEDSLIRYPNFKKEYIRYNHAKGPFQIYSLDPSAIPQGEYEIRMVKYHPNNPYTDDFYWQLFRIGGTDTAYGNVPISQESNQFVSQFKLWVRQFSYPRFEARGRGAVVQYSNPQDQWIQFVADNDIEFSGENWISCGTDDDSPNLDPNETFEINTDGIAAPYHYVSDAVYDTSNLQDFSRGAGPAWDRFRSMATDNPTSVKLVFTDDKTKYTRAAVLETGDLAADNFDNAIKLNIRRSPSVDKNGAPDGSGTIGWSWFPGYAVDISTGKRLHIMFGENSSDPQNNGLDMLFNPTSEIDDKSNPFNHPSMGGRHYIYIMNHEYTSDDFTTYPYYDNLRFLNGNPTSTFKRGVFAAVNWVLVPVANPQSTNWNTSKVELILTAQQKFERFGYNPNAVNDNYPRFKFNTNTIGFHELEASNPVMVYPNPSTDYIKFKFKSKHQGLGNLSIYNLEGKLMSQQNIKHQEETIDLSDFPAGVYIYFLEINGDTQAGKFIKQ